MRTETDVPLSMLTTFRLGGPARVVHTIEKENDLAELFAMPEMQGERWYALGSGSNVLPRDEGFDGRIILMRICGRELVGDDATSAFIRVGAGELWDSFVEDVVSRGLWGAENLSGIPGTVGAAPIQNVAAYGAEVAAIIDTVDVFDTRTRAVRSLTNEECRFGYRDSIFKKEEGKHLIVTAVTFRLAKAGAPDIAYKDLAERFSAVVGPLTPGLIRDGVLAIRAGKFPDLSAMGTAGSFFKNPVISNAAFETLQQAFPGIPSYPAADEAHRKIPVAWILDHVLGMKGFAVGPVGFFEHHALVLVARDGATARDVDRFADDVARRVHDATDIIIEREVCDLR